MKYPYYKIFLGNKNKQLLTHITIQVNIKITVPSHSSRMKGEGFVGCTNPFTWAGDESAATRPRALTLGGWGQLHEGMRQHSGGMGTYVHFVTTR